MFSIVFPNGPGIKARFPGMPQPWDNITQNKEANGYKKENYRMLPHPEHIETESDDMEKQVTEIGVKHNQLLKGI
jgi:hypothetical protein